MTFKEYKGLDLVTVGNEILDRWKRNHAFEKSLQVREGAAEFIFFEGPPSANGIPGIHHVMARSIKDAVCRYKTQTGFMVNRRAGWDTHGLPVEIGVEKKLGIHKDDIGTKISVEEYNKICRSEVMKYTKEWETMTERVGYWVDMNDPYITYDNRYIETLWYLLRKIYDKGLLYKGYSIQPYSPSDGTGLSSHELNQPGCYKDVTDMTVTVRIEVIKDAESQVVFGTETFPVYFLAWTTTPWTLPSNTALCGGPNIDYVRVLSFNPYTGKEAVYLVAKELAGTWFNPKAEGIALAEYQPGDKLVPWQILGAPVKGADLVGIHYHPLFPWFRPVEEGEPFRVVSGDFVSTEEGTGIVHIAPTFGADDKRVAANFGVPGMMVIAKEGKRQAQVENQLGLLLSRLELSRDELAARDAGDEESLVRKDKDAAQRAERERERLDEQQEKVEKATKCKSGLQTQRAGAQATVEGRAGWLQTILRSENCSDLKALKQREGDASQALTALQDSLLELRGQLPEEAEDPARQLKTARDAIIELQNEQSRLKNQTTRLQTLLEEAQRGNLYERKTRLADELERLGAELERATHEALAVHLLHTIYEHRRSGAAETLEGLKSKFDQLFRAICGIERPVTITPDFEATELQPAPDQGSQPIKQFSSGTQEQLNLCLRLAMGEVYAEKFGRQMMVLDDVLVYTDPDRHRRVMEIIKLAGEKLQIFIFTSHPDYYRGLTENRFDLPELVRQS